MNQNYNSAAVLPVKPLNSHYYSKKSQRDKEIPSLKDKDQQGIINWSQQFIQSKLCLGDRREKRRTKIK